MSDPIVPEEPGAGNTSTAPSTQSAPRKNWFFTWNNYSDSDIEKLTTWVSANCSKSSIGREVGEGGTPHLQGCITLKNKMRFTALKKLWPVPHWEKTWNPERAILYCAKDGDMVSAIGMPRRPRDPLAERTLYPWQQQLEERLSKPPDDRTILWIWEPVGCQGKTTFAKHLCITRPETTLFLGGKGADIKYGVQQFVSDGERQLEIAMFHFTRSNEAFVSYEALESIKDGIFFSGKYEAGMVVYDPPHVVVFANFEPERKKLSADRWEIIQLGETPAPPRENNIEVTAEDIDEILKDFS